MIYYVNPNIVSTSGKCSPNIRIYELNDDSSYTGYVYIYKNNTYLRKSYNRELNNWLVTRYPVACKLPTGSRWHPPMRFTTLELATAYAIVAYKASYTAAETKAQNTLANLAKHSALRDAAEGFIDANPEFFI